MSGSHIKPWLTMLEASCLDVPTPYLDIIIDQADSDATLLTGVKSVEPPLSWRLLFEGLPEAGVKDVGPLLVRVNLQQPLQRQWLIGLLHELHKASQLLVLASHWEFPELASYLTLCLEASHGRSQGLLRYYDPRVFPLLFNHVLAPEQQLQFARPAVFWSWMDRDGLPHHLASGGDPGGTVANFSPIQLSQDQLASLSCITDAAQAMSALETVLPAHWSQEQRFEACYGALAQATAQGVLAAADRDVYAHDMLVGHSAEAGVCRKEKP